MLVKSGAVNLQNEQAGRQIDGSVLLKSKYLGQKLRTGVVGGTTDIKPKFKTRRECRGGPCNLVCSFFQEDNVSQSISPDHCMHTPRHTLTHRVLLTR